MRGPPLPLVSALLPRLTDRQTDRTARADSTQAKIHADRQEERVNKEATDGQTAQDLHELLDEVPHGASVVLRSASGLGPAGERERSYGAKEAIVSSV
jgi:hypothetical protein